MPAQLANESFRADYVRFGNSVGAVMQVLMRSDIPAAEAFFRDHLRASIPCAARPTGGPVGCILWSTTGVYGTIESIGEIGSLKHPLVVGRPLDGTRAACDDSP
jgi:hypothetical protein